MKTVNKFGIQFIIRQDKLKNDKAPIRQVDDCHISKF